MSVQTAASSYLFACVRQLQQVDPFCWMVTPGKPLTEKSVTRSAIVNEQQCIEKKLDFFFHFLDYVPKDIFFNHISCQSLSTMAPKLDGGTDQRLVEVVGYKHVFLVPKHAYHR
jgi:hypothetical protein